ncbi:hypothetical protein TSUD_259760 [Trifolium subterraneum]|uniref:F-box domain-containing protein n=1 Tax=Trifolium subterraneum TaxID=3900 RepID=A0A2Z6MJQ4_TRISU|nr:hypothetical protein TSUD_259760 [Trifolium subterraneum]
MQRRLLLRQPNSSAIFPDELMVEIVSWLPVKHVMQLRCVNKFFNTLIFDLHFVQMHLNKSSRNLHLALRYYEPETNSCKSYLVTLTIPGLLQNQLTIFYHSDPYYQLNDYSLSRHMGHQSCMQQWVVGSCNGLICLYGVSYPSKDRWLCLWNPAMRTKSKNIWYHNHHFNFSFGYDNLTRSYKVVAVDVEVNSGRKPKGVVKVYSLGDNSWRDIQRFPLLPLYCFCFSGNNNNGVHLNGTINWLAFRDYSNGILPLDQCVILSLDLSTETYTQLLPPPGFDNVSWYHPPKLVILFLVYSYATQKGAAAMEVAEVTL